VCIATYNGEKYIKKQLDSIVKQLDFEDEVIISDDSSTDATVNILKSYEDPRIRIFLDQKFRSPIFNFEHALSLARGEFIFLSDQDDLWLNNKVNMMLAALRESDVVISNCRIIDGNDNVIEDSFFKINGSGRGLLRNLWKNSYLGCCLAVRKGVLKKTLPFPKDIPMHDWWIGIVAEAFFRITIIHEPLMHYRRHGINATPTGEKSHFSYWRRLLFRLKLVKGLINVWGKP